MSKGCQARGTAGTGAVQYTCRRQCCGACRPDAERTPSRSALLAMDLLHSVQLLRPLLAYLQRQGGGLAVAAIAAAAPAAAGAGAALHGSLPALPITRLLLVSLNAVGVAPALLDGRACAGRPHAGRHDRAKGEQCVQAEARMIRGADNKPAEARPLPTRG